MSDRDDDRHCDTCRCDELGTKYGSSVRTAPEVIPEAKALLAWSDEMGNSQPAWQFEECARIHPLFWYRDEDYPNEQVSYLQWGYNYEAEHLGEPNFFYATCFDLGGDQYECATDLEIVGAVYLLMRFPERPPAVGGVGGLWGPDEGTVTRRLWENQLDMCCRFVPRFARYVEQVARNHDETYPALQVVMDEIEKPEVPTPMGYNYIAYEILEGTEEEWTEEEQDLISTHNLLWVVHAMCEFVLDHKLGED